MTPVTPYRRRWTCAAMACDLRLPEATNHRIHTSRPADREYPGHGEQPPQRQRDMSLQCQRRHPPSVHPAPPPVISLFRSITGKIISLICANNLPVNFTIGVRIYFVEAVESKAIFHSKSRRSRAILRVFEPLSGKNRENRAGPARAHPRFSSL